jgi:hypothetical protein
VVGGGGVESEFSDQLWLWPSRTKSGSTGLLAVGSIFVGSVDSDVQLLQANTYWDQILNDTSIVDIFIHLMFLEF